MSSRPKTIFLDIDGTLLYHYGTQQQQIQMKTYDVLPGVHEKLHEWDQKGYKVILTTGRKESTRKITEKQLTECGIFYDQLIMGVTGGQRILINDQKADGTITAHTLCPERNKGIADIEI